jgi:curved DNA-binding protein CbpA
MRAQPVSPAPGPSVPVVRGPMVSPMRFDGKPPQAAPAKSAGAAHPAPASIEATRASIQDMAQKLGKATHFELLGVSQNASSDEVGTAFVRAARLFHPDRLIRAGLQDLQPLAEKILARINEATMVLGDATRRAEYIASLAAGPQAVHTSLPTLFEAENMFLKGGVFLKKGEHAKAVEFFTGACQRNPGEPQYRAFLAWARFEDPNARKDVLVRDTLKTMEEVVRERPKFARGFYWVGLLWKFLNEGDKAERAFREAVNLDASFIEAGRELRLIEMRKSKPPLGKPGAKPEPPRGGGLMGKLFKK